MKKAREGSPRLPGGGAFKAGDTDALGSFRGGIRPAGVQRKGAGRTVSKPLKALERAGILKPETRDAAEAAALGKADQLRGQILLCLVRERRLLKLIAELEAQDGVGKGAAGAAKGRLAAEEALTRVQGRLQEAVGLLHRMDHDAERIRVEDEKIAVVRRRLLMDEPDAEVISENALTLEGILGSPAPCRELDP